MNRCSPIRAALAIALLLSACTARRQPGDLTLQQLFERAREFDGKRVSVIGWYVSGMEESSLYTGPSAQDSLDDTFSRSVWVDPGWRRISRLTDRYVRVVGIFHYRPEAEHRIEKREDGREFESVIPRGYGHMGLSPAELTGVTFFRPLR